MAKLACCHTCAHYAPQTGLVCALHPTGQAHGYCADHQPGDPKDFDPQPPGEEPGGVALGSEVAIDRQYLLDSHPFFTGRCPHCEMPIADPSPKHWHCPACGLSNNS